jgi:hypothetical protein
MNAPALKLDLTIPEIDMCFVLFQSAKQDKYTFDEISALMRKIQSQGKPQIEALAVKAETPPPAPKVRKPREPKAAPVVAVDPALPDLSDLKLD